jgi:hypothetical protein
MVSLMVSKILGHTHLPLLLWADSGLEHLGEICGRAKLLTLWGQAEKREGGTERDKKNPEVQRSFSRECLL